MVVGLGWCWGSRRCGILFTSFWVQVTFARRESVRHFMMKLNFQLETRWETSARYFLAHVQFLQKQLLGTRFRVLNNNSPWTLRHSTSEANERPDREFIALKWCIGRQENWDVKPTSSTTKRSFLNGQYSKPQKRQCWGFNVWSLQHSLCPDAFGDNLVDFLSISVMCRFCVCLAALCCVWEGSFDQTETESHWKHRLELFAALIPRRLPTRATARAVRASPCAT